MNEILSVPSSPYQNDSVFSVRSSGNDGSSFANVLGNEIEKSEGSSSLLGKLNIESLLGVETSKPGVVTLNDIQRGAEKALREFKEDLSVVMVNRGIDVRQEIQLGTRGETADVYVKNAHPNKEQIERLFAENPELSNEYKRITNMFSMVEAGRQSLEFQRAYANNPQMAVQQYAHLFNSNVEADLILNNGDAAVSYGTSLKG